MATWPTLLPRPQLSGYALNLADQTVRTDMEVGSERNRRRTHARNDQIEVQWLFTDREMTIFRAWFEGSEYANGGAAWFTVDLANGEAGVRPAEARFVGAPKAVPTGGLNWQVTATLKTRGGELTAIQVKAIVLNLLTASGVYPSLILDFAGDKTLDSRITFARAGVATYFDATGVLRTAPHNTPRFDHDPVTGESLGLLVEEARWNYLRRSMQFDFDSWVKRGTCTVTPDVEIAPDGNLSADLIQNLGNSLANDIYQSITLATGTRAEPSFFIKKVSTTGVLRAVSPLGYHGNGEWRIDLSLLDAGWNRIVRSHPAVTIVAEFVGSSANHCGLNLYAYTGAPLSFYIWGAQLEAGTFTTSYILTYVGAAYRSQDSASMTGTNFSSWYRQDEGTFVAQFGHASLQNNPAAFSANNGTSEEELVMYSGTGLGETWFCRDGNAIQANMVAGAQLAENVYGTMAGAYAQNDFAASLNGAACVLGASGTLPYPTQLNIGKEYNSSLNLNGRIKRLIYYPARLPNAELVELTRA